MNNLLAIAMMNMLALPVVAGHIAAKSEYKRSVVINLDVRANVPLETLMCATSIASRVFETAGVRLAWRWYNPKGCEREHAIIVEVTTATPELLYPGALACARAFEGAHIRVFYDRVRSIGEGNEDLIPKLLAYVLAHEITHILQRTDRHSTTGVMKARWTIEDIVQISHGRLLFDPFDVELIHEGLRDRTRAMTVASLTKADAARARNSGN